jgi:hypothetical protein
MTPEMWRELFWRMIIALLVCAFLFLCISVLVLMADAMAGLN